MEMKKTVMKMSVWSFYRTKNVVTKNIHRQPATARSIGNRDLSKIVADIRCNNIRLTTFFSVLFYIVLITYAKVQSYNFVLITYNF